MGKTVKRTGGSLQLDEWPNRRPRPDINHSEPTLYTTLN